MHRAFALVALGLLAALAWRLWRARAATGTRPALWVGALAALQLASGLSNVVLGWPLPAALLHSAGAAALVAITTSLLSRPTVAWCAPAPAAKALSPHAA